MHKCKKQSILMTFQVHDKKSGESIYFEEVPAEQCSDCELVTFDIETLEMLVGQAYGAIESDKKISKDVVIN